MTLQKSLLENVVAFVAACAAIAGALGWYAIRLHSELSQAPLEARDSVQARFVVLAFVGAGVALVGVLMGLGMWLRWIRVCRDPRVSRKLGRLVVDRPQGSSSREPGREAE
jgi:hypothetical protein